MPLNIRLKPSGIELHAPPMYPYSDEEQVLVLDMDQARFVYESLLHPKGNTLSLHEDSSYHWTVTQSDDMIHIIPRYLNIQDGFITDDKVYLQTCLSHLFPEEIN